MNDEYFIRLNQIDTLKEKYHSALPAFTMQPINIYGKDHKAAAHWLKSTLVNCSKAEEILIRAECEKLFGVIVSSQ